MAFVTELIPETEKGNFTFHASTRRDGSKPTLWKWTVDRERDAFLVFTNAEGGGYEGTQLTWHCILSWKGNLISIAADPKPTGGAPTGQLMSWRVHGLAIPPGLQGQHQAVLQLVREAFEATGGAFDRDRYISVKVTFDLPYGR